MKVYAEHNYGGWTEVRKTAPMRASGGNMGGGTENIVVEDNVYDVNGTETKPLDKANTLDTSCRGCYGKQNGTVVFSIEGNGSRESHHGPGYNESNKMYTLNTVERHTVAQVSTGWVQMAVDVRNSKEADINGALQSRASNNVQSNNVVRQQYVVRRLTSLECERLQGLPDNFTLIDDKSCSDSARYKAIGNGMCQICADWIIKRIVEEVGEQSD